MIPLFRPSLPTEAESGPYLKKARASGQWTNFGSSWQKAREILRVRHGGKWIPVSNGTTALEAALSIFPRGSRVAIPDFTFAATALAVIRAGLEPVIVGCRFQDCAMKTDVIFENAGEFDLILPVACFGYEFPFEEFDQLSHAMHIPLVYDLAGAYPMIDPHDNLSCYSLHAAKSLPIGEGGLIRAYDPEMEAQILRVINFGFDENKRCLSDRGFNGKMDERHAAVLIAQLHSENLLADRIQNHRDQIEYYQTQLRDYVENPVTGHLEGHPSLCVLRGMPGPEIEDLGRQRGITFRRYYYPLLSEMEGFDGYKKIGSNDSGLDSYLAFPSDVTPGEAAQVVQCVKDAFNLRSSSAV